MGTSGVRRRDFLNLDEVEDRLDHPADRGGVLEGTAPADAPETQTHERSALTLGATD